MTPEQLQAAKDQGAQLQGFTSFVRMMGTDNLKSGRIEASIDNALRIMYEAGKKDGEEKAKFWEDAARNVNAIAEDESDMIEKLYVESNKEAETYRKALEEIRDWEDIHDGDGLDAIDMIDGIQKIASEALKGKI